MRSGDHLGDAKCQKWAPRSVEFNFLLIAIDRNGFHGMKVSLTQFQPVTTRRVKDLLMKMNEKKAAGHDGICSRELKVVADKIAWQLATLFNESLETGEIPSDFKVGNIIPIFKSGKKDVTAPENYRGISLTPLVSKVLERIVFDEVSAFLSNRKLLSKFQFGFRASHRVLLRSPPCNSR